MELAIYFIIVIFLFPALMLVIGAAAKVRRANTRLHRLQLEGAAILAAGMLAKWLVYDVNFGIDPFERYRWTPWFARAEAGGFWIGLLFLALGYFLERRPRPGITPWPLSGKVFCGVFILGGLALSRFAASNLGLAFLDLPWTIHRIFLVAGLYPFCLGYFYGALRFVDPVPPHLGAEGE
ncbi:MAG: hypothetical protein GC168_13680 [Candidatus Hydrogenedens sp.]|nr:hypothetical protein [Candidatus Hydrogenedens sp.]